MPRVAYQVYPLHYLFFPALQYQSLPCPSQIFTFSSKSTSPRSYPSRQTTEASNVPSSPSDSRPPVSPPIPLEVVHVDVSYDHGSYASTSIPPFSTSLTDHVPAPQPPSHRDLLPRDEDAEDECALKHLFRGRVGPSQGGYPRGRSAHLCPGRNRGWEDFLSSRCQSRVAASVGFPFTR